MGCALYVQAALLTACRVFMDTYNCGYFHSAVTDIRQYFWLWSKKKHSNYNSFSTIRLFEMCSRLY